uniref:Transmembrane domain containing protein n=1 Tax=Marseillevirus sp. TaxID=2809551 RepID=A0AA96EM93_9VIRU|nr:transmembrane domain containing protein [Marseillevirus sp.]
MSKVKTVACTYAVSAVPPYLLFCIEEGVKLGWSEQKTFRSFASSFGFAMFKGVFYPYYFYKYAKGEISF